MWKFLKTRWERMEGNMLWDAVKFIAKSWRGIVIIIVSVAGGAWAWFKDLPAWSSLTIIVSVGVLCVFAACAWEDRKKKSGNIRNDPSSMQQTTKQGNLLNVSAIETKKEVGGTVMYGCDIELTNMDGTEAANGVNVRITTFTPGPKNFYTPDISNPSPAELPIRLELNGRSANIGPGSVLRLELFALIRAGPVATIAITGNGKKHRWFHAEIKSRAGSAGPILSYERYRFTLEVSAENRRKATWRIDLNIVNDSNGIPKVEVEKVEEICI